MKNHIILPIHIKCIRRVVTGFLLKKIENISVIIQTVKQLWNVPKSSIPNIVRSIGANVVAPILITTDK